MTHTSTALGPKTLISSKKTNEKKKRQPNHTKTLAPSPHLRHLRLSLTPPALEAHLPQVRNSDQPALVAHVHPVRVRVHEQTVPQEVRAAVTDQAVSLHLSHTQPTVARSTLHGLPRQVHHGSPTSAVDLVVHQVLQPLVEGWPKEHLFTKNKKVRREDGGRGRRGGTGGLSINILFAASNRYRPLTYPCPCYHTTPGW